ncbi:cytochrome b [Caulobacter sp. NIBR1757]|uniref:cytochrome b n=1 Tax=Caulobacter sp. NIBR1757 TaxID=3016000 RepID=UPI0022EFF5B7|nr:cytochrome b [Caulobacter sp. NIBR1757]WGM37934.1 Cytochrome b561 [Caulobacter sp. NIBR1757]
MSTASSRYSTVAMILHWLIAALIIANVALAWTADEMPRSTAAGLMAWHKTFGISVLLLSLVRLVWRLTHKSPPLGDHLKAWERILARVVHWAFYGLMIGLPLTGWALVSASPLIKVYPIDMFGLFHWPAIGPLANLPPDQMKGAHETWEEVHHLLAKVLIYGLIPLHILGALKHQFLDKDNELGRMIPFMKAPK